MRLVSLVEPALTGPLSVESGLGCRRQGDLQDDTDVLLHYARHKRERAMRSALAVAVLTGGALAGVPLPGVPLPGVPLPGVAAAAQTPWVLLARRAIGRVEQLTQPPDSGKPGADVASVLVEAPAARVYATALDVIHRNQAVTILGQDPAHFRLELAEGERRATLGVISLGDKLSQLIIAGTTMPGEAPASSRVVATVLRICREMHKQCTVSG